MKRLSAQVLVLCLVAACGEVGSGDIVSESRTVGEFDRIDATSGVVVEITVDADAAAEVTVVYDDNLQDQVVTTVDDGTLMIAIEGQVISVGSGRRVEVVTPSLTHLTVSGGAVVDGSGEAGDLTLEVGGGSNVDLSGLVVQTAEVDVSAGSRVTVNTPDHVGGAVSGGALLIVQGDPASRDLDVSGGARVDG